MKTIPDVQRLYARLDELRGGEPKALVAPIVDALVGHMPTQLEALESAAGQGNTATAREAAHTLKGAFLNLNATDAAAAAAAAEAHAKASELEALRVACLSVASLVPAIVDGARAYLQGEQA